MKGVLRVKGSDRRFVFQGAHRLFDGRPDRPWGAESSVQDRPAAAAVQTATEGWGGTEDIPGCMRPAEGPSAVNAYRIPSALPT